MIVPRGWQFSIFTVAFCIVLTACSDASTDHHSSPSGRTAAGRIRTPSGNNDFAPGSADGFDVLAFLAAGTPGNSYRVEPDTALLHGGTIVGRIEGGANVIGDTVITPLTESTVCDPFTETIVPSDNHGVGNAVAWLVGVTSGPPPNAPRRITLTLDRCQLQPRVQRMALGSSILVKSRDAMTSQLTFTEFGSPIAPRAQIDFSDAGQVVPSGKIALTPGIVEVRDARHPWVRAFAVVAPHPFVEVTSANGQFRFDSVPPGDYTLVVWQEALGVRTRTVRVTSGVETRVVVGY